MKQPIRVITVDDHLITREGVKSLLKQPDICVVGEGRAGSDVLPLIEIHQPDVLLLDISMPQFFDGKTKVGSFKALSAIRQINRDHPAVSIVLISAFLDNEIIDSAFDRGIRGYVVKSDFETTDLANVVRIAHSGRIILSEQIQDLIIAKQTGQIRLPNLTKRQREVISYVAHHMNETDQVIAAGLHIKDVTLRNHLTNINKALGTTNRGGAVLACIRYGLVPFETDFINSS